MSWRGRKNRATSLEGAVLGFADKSRPAVARALTQPHLQQVLVLTAVRFKDGQTAESGRE